MSKIIKAILAAILSLFGGKRAEPAVRPPETLTPPRREPARDIVQWAADELDADLAAAKAVLEVESGGRGVLPSGRAVVRFEGATFSRLTGGEFDRAHPTLSMRNWRDNKDHVRGGEAEWDRLYEAARLDRNEAYKSASYGAAQIMGFNYEVAGYPDVHAFIADMNAGEAGQIRAFVNFVKGKGLAAALQAKDWRAFARGYNGSGQVDRYATALQAAYNRIVGAAPIGGTPTANPFTEPSRKWDDYRDIPLPAWRQRWRNFTPVEIGGKEQDPSDREIIVVPSALDALQALRAEWGRPITITSGYRSVAYNRRVGGATNSQHLLGRAFDCAVAGDDQEPFIAMARKHGFKGIGRYRTFTHIDNREGRAATWRGR